VTGRPRIKICCIASLDEARLAVDAGAAALGLVSAMPSGPGVIDEATIAAIAAATPREVDTFLLTAHTDAAAILEQHRRCRTTTLQLVDALAPRELRELRRTLPRVTLVQVVHVTGPSAIDEALAVAPMVDALLLDSGNPALAVKQLGGTGRTHDWSVSREIVERAGVPVWLAGGLNPGNVAEAIETVRPHGLDLCNGVRSDGRLDDGKLRAFFDAAAQAPSGASPRATV
jgi:phosphoribosylanthranilate isomerase